MGAPGSTIGAGQYAPRSPEPCKPLGGPVALGAVIRVLLPHATPESREYVGTTHLGIPNVDDFDPQFARRPHSLALRGGKPHLRRRGVEPVDEVCEPTSREQEREAGGLQRFQPVSVPQAGQSDESPDDLRRGA